MIITVHEIKLHVHQVSNQIDMSHRQETTIIIIFITWINNGRNELFYTHFPCNLDYLHIYID